MANSTVENLNDISTGSPATFELTDLLYVFRPGAPDLDFKADGQDVVNLVATNAGADFIDAITEIKSTLKTVADATLVTGTKTTTGAVIEWNADGDAVDTGVLVTDLMRLGTAQEYTKQHNFNATTLTDGVNISWNLDDNQVASVTLAGNRTLDNPTNLKDGATYVLTVKQDATGSRTLAYGTAYKWPGGTAPTLSTGANAVDILTFVCDGTNMYGVAQLNFS
jgi:hypothetical protein